MPNYVIPQPAQPSLPVRGTDARFPVRRIYCIGRNYADHAIEMGHDPDKEPPFFFQKNGDNVDSSGEFPYPPQTNDCLLYTSPSPRDATLSRMPSSA